MASRQTKICSKCGEEKPAQGFFMHEKNCKGKGNNKTAGSQNKKTPPPREDEDDLLIKKFLIEEDKKIEDNDPNTEGKNMETEINDEGGSSSKKLIALLTIPIVLIALIVGYLMSKSKQSTQSRRIPVVGRNLNTSKKL